MGRIIDDLQLTKVADSLIFMLSGGEQKRVNVGTELLTDPALIFSTSRRPESTPRQLRVSFPSLKPSPDGTERRW